jgi:hypothetical protein
MKIVDRKKKCQWRIVLYPIRILSNTWWAHIDIGDQEDVFGGEAGVILQGIVVGHCIGNAARNIANSAYVC